MNFETGILVNTTRGLSAKLVDSDGVERWHNGGIFDGKRALIAGPQGIVVRMNTCEPRGDNPDRQLVMRGEVLGMKVVGFKTDHPHIISIVPDTGLEDGEKPDPVAFF